MLYANANPIKVKIALILCHCLKNSHGHKIEKKWVVCNIQGIEKRWYIYLDVIRLERDT